MLLPDLSGVSLTYEQESGTNSTNYYVPAYVWSAVVTNVSNATSIYPACQSLPDAKQIHYEDDDQSPAWVFEISSGWTVTIPLLGATFYDHNQSMKTHAQRTVLRFRRKYCARGGTKGSRRRSITLCDCCRVFHGYSRWQQHNRPSRKCQSCHTHYADSKYDGTLTDVTIYV